MKPKEHHVSLFLLQVFQKCGKGTDACAADIVESVAVENDPENLYFLKNLKKAEDRNFTVFDKSIFSLDTGRNRYDIALALAIFHHFTKGEKTYNQLVKFLQDLNVGEMYFEPPDPKEPQMQSAFRNYSCEEFINFIAPLIEDDSLTFIPGKKGVGLC